MSATDTTKYFKTLARFLRSDLSSDDPVRRAGALERIRRLHSAFAAMSDEEVVETFRATDAVAVIAKEQGYPGWRDFLARTEERAAPQVSHRTMCHRCYSTSPAEGPCPECGSDDVGPGVYVALVSTIRRTAEGRPPTTRVAFDAATLNRKVLETAIGEMPETMSVGTTPDEVRELVRQGNIQEALDRMTDPKNAYDDDALHLEWLGLFLPGVSETPNVDAMENGDGDGPLPDEESSAWNLDVKATDERLEIRVGNTDGSSISEVESGQGDGIGEQYALRFTTEAIESRYEAGEEVDVAWIGREVRERMGAWEVVRLVDDDGHLNIYVEREDGADMTREGELEESLTPEPPFVVALVAPKVRAVPAQYTSVWDDSIEVTTRCLYDPVEKRAFDIEVADNSAAEHANALTDEYVTLEDGTVLRESDGIDFDY